MLPKNKRVPRELFKNLLGSKKFFHSPHFSLRVAQDKSTKVSVSVSKKVSKKAVIRNRIRRRVYAALQKIFKELQPGLHMFVAKPNSIEVKGDVLKQELAELVKKV